MIMDPKYYEFQQALVDKLLKRIETIKDYMPTPDDRNAVIALQEAQAHLDAVKSMVEKGVL